MVDLDIEMFDVVVLARSGKAPFEHVSVRRRLLRVAKGVASAQNKGSVWKCKKEIDVSPTKL